MCCPGRDHSSACPVCRKGETSLALESLGGEFINCDEMEDEPWDPKRALELWQKRVPENGEPLPDVFAGIPDVTEASTDIVGRNRLVLKAKNSDELMYYTTDNE